MRQCWLNIARWSQKLLHDELRFVVSVRCHVLSEVDPQQNIIKLCCAREFYHGMHGWDLYCRWHRCYSQSGTLAAHLSSVVSQEPISGSWLHHKLSV